MVSDEFGGSSTMSLYLNLRFVGYLTGFFSALGLRDCDFNSFYAGRLGEDTESPLLI